MELKVGFALLYIRNKSDLKLCSPGMGEGGGALSSVVWKLEQLSIIIATYMHPFSRLPCENDRWCFYNKLGIPESVLFL